MSLWQTQSWQDMLIASGQSEEYFVIESALPLACPILGEKGVPDEGGGIIIKRDYIILPIYPQEYHQHLR